MNNSTLPKLNILQKPTVIKVAEDIDFYKLFSKIEQMFDTCFLLESLSATNDERDRYSFIGFTPQHIVKAHSSTLYFDNKPYRTTNPYAMLRKILPPPTIGRNFTGGLVGYLGYDCVNYFEPSLSVKTHPQHEQFKFGIYTDGLMYDKTTAETFYFHHGGSRLKLVQKIIAAPAKDPPIFDAIYLGDNMSQKEHAKTVMATKEAIRLGKIFQCEVGLKSKFKITGSTLGVYEKLRDVNPSPFMYYVKFGQQKLIGASPELLFSIKDGIMTTRPLAGSIRRGKDTTEDIQLARQLLNDPKEIAEHRMLVDLHRNDLGRVAEAGSVTITHLMAIKKFSHVQHIESEAIGKISPDEDMFSALAANFPAGTLSGAPKIEAIKIIDENEPEPRGPYGGGVGYFGFNSDAMFAIAIRSLFVHGTDAFIQTSGGNVYDSVPENEYDEIQHKLAAMKEVLGV